MEGNGIKAELRFINQQIQSLWKDKASKESVENLDEDLKRIETSIKDLKNSFRSLQLSILVACVTWSLGSAGFLIAILTIRGR